MLPHATAEDDTNDRWPDSKPCCRPHGRGAYDVVMVRASPVIRSTPALLPGDGRDGPSPSHRGPGSPVGRLQLNGCM
jgi:hypothetical protein